MLSSSTVLTGPRLIVFGFCETSFTVHSPCQYLHFTCFVSCKAAWYSSLFLILELLGFSLMFSSEFLWWSDKSKNMQILPHLFASGLLFFLCLRHWPSFSSSTYVAHLLSGVMDVFSVIRRTPHEFKIACLQVSVVLCNGAWSHKTQ